MVMRTIPAGEFKAKCLALMDEVAATGDEIVITKRGKPVARLKAERPYGPNEPDMSGTLTFAADGEWESATFDWDPSKFDDLSK
jgi:prevent-host-death family protein